MTPDIRDCLDSREPEAFQVMLVIRDYQDHMERMAKGVNRVNGEIQEFLAKMVP